MVVGGAEVAGGRQSVCRGDIDDQLRWVRQRRVCVDDGKTRRSKVRQGKTGRTGSGKDYAHRPRRAINPQPSMTDPTANASLVLEACWIMAGLKRKSCARSGSGTVVRFSNNVGRRWRKRKTTTKNDDKKEGENDDKKEGEEENKKQNPTHLNKPSINQHTALNASNTPLNTLAVSLPGLYISRISRPIAIPMGGW